MFVICLFCASFCCCLLGFSGVCCFAFVRLLFWLVLVCDLIVMIDTRGFNGLLLLLIDLNLCWVLLVFVFGCLSWFL